MLSRVADNLYWMSRYLERAEYTARLLDENLHQMLDQNTIYAQQRWQRLRTILHMQPSGDGPDEVYHMTRILTFDLSNAASIASCIASARENARQVREEISSEMWIQLNQLYLQIRQTDIDEIWHAEPHAFLTAVKEGVQLFRGIADATMNHSEGWYFIRMGCFLERAMSTALLLDAHFSVMLQSAQDDTSVSLDYLGWVGLLRSCTAFEAYCKVYSANVQPAKIAEFLLLNAESPRSVRYAAAQMQIALQSVSKSTHTRHAGRVERLAGRLRSALEYDQIEDVMQDMHAYLENIQRQCSQIHNAIYQVYIAYPIDAVLVSGGATQA
jgi:uncharacterized alpha-E superfamily protein